LKQTIINRLKEPSTGSPIFNGGRGLKQDKARDFVSVLEDRPSLMVGVD
jgi:hypothetical protein